MCSQRLHREIMSTSHLPLTDTAIHSPVTQIIYDLKKWTKRKMFGRSHAPAHPTLADAFTTPSLDASF